MAKLEKGERELHLARGASMVGLPWRKDSSKLFSFLSIFHPDMSLEDRLQLTKELRYREDKR